MAANYYNVTNVLIIGEPVINGTVGAPLSVSSTGTLASGISNTEVSGSSSVTSGTSDVLLTGMTITPVSGTYMVWFSCDVTSPTAGDAISFSIYVGGVQKADSLRKIIPFSGGTLTTGNARGCAATNGVVTVNGSQAIEIRWSSSTGGVTAQNRTMSILRVS